MEEHRDTPPYSGSNTPLSEPIEGVSYDYATPTSLDPATPDITPQKPTIPQNLTQEIVDANPELKRFQQDLMILTSFNDNDTLHWRPSWFKQEPYSKNFWTLYNPPNVVTEQLPHPQLGRPVYTRRMKRHDDHSPIYMETWDQWERVCVLNGIPSDFLCEEQIKLMRLGLPRDTKGALCAPPNYPLYPEPQPVGQGRYILNTDVNETHLPPKFHNLRTTGPDDKKEVVVVHSTGELKIELRENFLDHPSQWTHYDGQGGYVNDVGYVPDFAVPKDQAKGRRWSYLPWTREQEESCRVEDEAEDANAGAGGGGSGAKLKLKLRLWNSAKKDEGASDGPRRSKRLTGE